MGATELLFAWSEGDARALDRLVSVIYPELRRLAKKYMDQERPDHTLQPTALVNEAYLRLIDVAQMKWQNRAHFFAVSARIMRHILVDHARRRRRQKRGGDASHLAFDDSLANTSGEANDLVALDDALGVLATTDARLSEVVELRYFGGLSVEETAAVLNVSLHTVMRDWKTAKVWLLREMKAQSKRGLDQS